MALFSNKSAGRKDIPISQVRTMRGQGLDNNKIIQTLQRDGYDSNKIFEAMNQVDMPQNLDEMPNLNQMPETLDDLSPPVNNAAAPMPAPAPSPSFSAPTSSIPNFNQNSPEIEELVESIIEEKWEDIERDIKKVVEWKNATEARVNAMETDFQNLKEEFNRLHQAVIGKISEYDKNILTVGAEVKAMEKVFAKVLPVFTEKVNLLADVADVMQKKPQKK